jgi:hypothetical protein
VTSARKLHLFSRWEILRESCRWLIGGPEAYQRREGVDFWYGRGDKR